MSTDWSAAVRSAGVAAISEADLPAFRSELQLRLASRALHVNLRHAGDQNVAALSAILNAIDVSNQDVGAYRDWGIVAAPRMPGRKIMISAVERFATNGAWYVSPQIIPSSSLHSLSGFVSVTFKMMGPNYGVGGVCGREAEVFLASPALLDDSNVPGVWTILTGWDNREGSGKCLAIALALESARLTATPRISIAFGGAEVVSLPSLTLESFFDVLSLSNQGTRGHAWSILNGGRLEWNLPSIAPLEVAA